ncbi:hypothetical protein Tco_0366705 [Tanacetum coccineum]
MESVKKSIDKRALHKRKYESRVNERHMQTKEGKVDMCKALDASLVVTESSGTKFEEQNTSSSSGNDADANDADIKPHVEQPEFNNEGGVNQNVEQCPDTRPLLATITDKKLTELSNLKIFVSKRPLPRQHGQFLNGKSNEAKVKYDIDEIETINIELEHSVVKLLKEKEQLN